MAEIQKIFFYTGTALVEPDPDPRTLGCVVHSGQRDFTDEGLCKAPCNKALTPVYECKIHPGTFTEDSEELCEVSCNLKRKYKKHICTLHKEVAQSSDDFCKERCGKKLHPEKESGNWRCFNKNHDKGKFYEDSEKILYCGDTCNQPLKAIYQCEIPGHDKEFPMESKCKDPCNQKMKKLAGYRCSVHPQNMVDSKDVKCKEPCGLSILPLVTALGYRRNVSVFMKYVGMHIDNGKDWGFCVNVAHDHKFQPPGKPKLTLSAGRRRFRYYTPTGDWNDETDVDKYLQKMKSLNGKFELFVNTASLLKNRTTPLSLGWKDRYDLVQGFGPKQGTKKTVDNCSAKCFSSDLDALKEWLSEAVKDQSVFAVCDCNSFHNSAFLFGLLALSRHVKSTWQIDQVNLQKVSAKNSKINTVAELSPEPVLVLNFDRHNDEGKDIKFANSDGWGKPLLESLKTGAYLAIGVPEGRRSGGIVLCIRRNMEEGQYELKKLSGKNLDELISEIQRLNPESSSQQDENSSGGGAPSLPSMDEKKPANKMDFQRFENKDKWKEIFEQIETFLNTHVPEHKKKKSLKYYYITIDRDCMLHNHNQWSDDLPKGERGASFFSDEKHIHKAIEAIRKALGEDAVLTGMDITGLPESQYLPGTGKTLVSIPRKEDLESVRKRDKNCVYSECKKAKSPIAGCPSQECKKDEKTFRWKCIGNKRQRNKENNEKKILRHPDCGHKICPYKSCPSANCPEPECKECRTEIMSKLGNEIDFWYKKFDGWISKQEKKEEKV